MPPKRARENNRLAAFNLTTNNLLGTVSSKKPRTAKKTKRATPAATPANARANAAAANLARANANVTRTSPAKQRTPGVTKKTKKVSTSVKINAGTESLNSFLRSKLTSGSYREKVVWSFLIRTFNEQNVPDLERMYKSTANAPTRDKFIRMARSISAHTVNVDANNEVVLNYDDERVFVHYFMLWADGRHDEYITVSFRTFLTDPNSYIRQLHLITSKAEKVIVAQLDTGRLPKIIQNIMVVSNLIKYDADKRDFVTYKKKDEERKVKIELSKIFEFNPPVDILKGQYPDIGKRIELCIDQDGKPQNLSKMLIGGESRFSLAITPEQSVDPGALMVMTGFSSIAAMLLGSETFTARLYASMPKMVYKYKGELLYSTKLRPVTPQTVSLVNAPVFEYYLETAGRQGVQIPYGESGSSARKGGILSHIGKALGDNEQMAPILFGHRRQSSQVKTFFATGDGMCAFQFCFLFSTMYPGEQPTLFVDTALDLGSKKSVWAYGLGSSYKIRNSRVAHVKARSPEIATRRSIFGRSKKTTNQANKFRVAATTFTPAQRTALANISNRTKQTYNRALAVKKIGRLAQNENFNRVKGLLNEWKVKKKLSERKQGYLTVMRTIQNKAHRAAIRNTYYKRNKYVSNSNSNSPS
jgi:hypothetical protein